MKALLQEKRIQWNGKPGTLIISINLTHKDTFASRVRAKGVDGSQFLSVRELFERTGQRQVIVRDKFVGEDHAISIEPFLETDPDSVLTVEFDFKFDDAVFPSEMVDALHRLGMSSEDVSRLLDKERAIKGNQQR